jgi:hypothetical protein
LSSTPCPSLKTICSAKDPASFDDASKVQSLCFIHEAFTIKDSV